MESTEHPLILIQFMDLPLELKEHILSWLSLKDVQSMAVVSKEFKVRNY
jgi:hypothetical protein